MKLRRCRRRRRRRRRGRGRSGWHCATKKMEEEGGKGRGGERRRARDQGGITEMLPSLSANRN